MIGLSELQHLLRKDTGTGSTVPAYLGFSPFQSPLEAWEINAGLRKFEGNANTEAGSNMEKGLGEWACRDLGIEDATAPTVGFMREHASTAAIDQIVKRIGIKAWTELAPDEPITILHPGQLGFGATPDFITLGGKIGIQIKNHNPHVARKYKDLPQKQGKWDNNAVPLYINLQCQWERWICAHAGILDAEAWLLVSYFGGGDRRIYWIRNDRDLTNTMVAAMTRFWAQHLDPNGPRTPPTDWPWRAAPAKERKRMKLSADEMAYAPVPFSPDVPALPEPKIPFLD